MHFKYCPDCGTKLSSRELGDEGAVPWCDSCNKPLFDMFPVAIISLVYNERGEVLLLQQNYISTDFHNLVSGYIQPGETAEECAAREILEETGQVVTGLELELTHWFAKKEMMMIGFFARVDSRELKLSSEVDSAQWYPPEKILALVSNRPGSTSRILCQRYIMRLQTASSSSSASE